MAQERKARQAGSCKGVAQAGWHRKRKARQAGSCKGVAQAGWHRKRKARQAGQAGKQAKQLDSPLVRHVSQSSETLPLYDTCHKAHASAPA